MCIYHIYTRGHYGKSVVNGPRLIKRYIQRSDNRNLIENGHVGRTALEASCVAHTPSQQARLHPWLSAA